ncbi:MAG: hypothetical protein HOH42_10035 [Ilumatobacter sp.]|nr:hypothetical protein [Ilumatobacter sp.]
MTQSRRTIIEMFWMMAFFAMITGGPWQDRVPVEDLGVGDRAAQVQVE